MSTGRKIDIGRFTGQQELKDIFSCYTEAYMCQPDARPAYDEFNAMQVLRAQDGSAVYFYVPIATFGSDKQIKDNAAIGRNIAVNIIDVAAYFLAQVISPDDVPDELRLCLGVCHNNSHWTGVMATITSFRAFYAMLHRDCFSDIDYHAESSTVIFNRAKNSIYEKLGVILSSSDDATPENEKAAIVLRTIGSDHIQIDHYDSMNSKAYAKRVDLSLHAFTKTDQLKKANHILCSQQKGNTCGDHTTLNLFMASMFKDQPVINGADSITARCITSRDLRELTDKIANPEGERAGLIALAERLISNPSRASLKDSIRLSESKSLVEFNKFIEGLINKLYKKCPSMIFELYHAAKEGNIDEIKATKDLYQNELVDEGCDIAETLVAVFKGEFTDNTKKIFSDMTESDRAVYGNLARIIAEERVNRIQTKDIKKEKGELATKEQEEALKSYEKSSKEKAIVTDEEKASKQKEQKEELKAGKDESTKQAVAAESPQPPAKSSELRHKEKRRHHKKSTKAVPKAKAEEKPTASAPLKHKSFLTKEDKAIAALARSKVELVNKIAKEITRLSSQPSSLFYSSSKPKIAALRKLQTKIRHAQSDKELAAKAKEGLDEIADILTKSRTRPALFQSGKVKSKDFLNELKSDIKEIERKKRK